jgi:hypothetical protein
MNYNCTVRRVLSIGTNLPIFFKLYFFSFCFLKVILPDYEEREVFLLDDGIQAPVAFTSSKRSLVVATFARFLLRNIGMLG